MRALCMECGGGFPGYDVAFVARRNVTESPFDTMLSNLRRALAKAEIVVE